MHVKSKKISKQARIHVSSQISKKTSRRVSKKLIQ